MQLMNNIRESIKEDTFPEFVRAFMTRMFPDLAYPEWVIESLLSVNIDLKRPNIGSVENNRKDIKS